MQEVITQMMTTRGIINFLLAFTIGILVVIAARMPFIHKKYEFTNSIQSPEYKVHRENYKLILKKREAVYKSLLNQLDKGLITKEDYVAKFKIAHSDIVLELREYAKEKKALLDSYKYNGFNAYYLFLLNIGTPIMSFILCLFFIYTIFNPISTKSKKIVFAIYSSLFLFSSSYLILHALLADKLFNSDFPDSWYTNSLLYIPLIIAFTIPLLFYHFQTIEQKLKSYIKLLFTYIYENRDDIKLDKQAKNKLKRGELINKALKINV